MTKQIREEVKKALISQGGKFYGYNYNEIKVTCNCTTTDIQNAVNYYQFSAQQKKFREAYNIH